MILLDYRYVEIVRDSASNRGNVVQLPDGKSNYDLDYYSKQVVDGFHSAFLQTKDYADYNDGSGGKKNYSGKVFSGCLFWDFDNEDVTKAKEDTIELVERLIAYKRHNIRIYFSGNKGFHVIYICPEELLRVKDVGNFEQLVKVVCGDLAKGLNSFDNRIYDKTRIIRTPNSKNSGSWLYKVPISYEELKILSVESIRDIAKHQRKMEYEGEIQYDEDLYLFIKSLSEIKPEKTTRITSDELVNGVLNGFEKGNRNSGLASLAGLLHSRNLSDDVVLGLVQSINQSSNDPLPQNEVATICRSICRYRVDNINDKPVEEKLVTIRQAAASWKEGMTSSGFTSFGERFSHLNNRLDSIIIGDTVGIVAGSGVGKSTIGMELGNEEAKAKGQYSLFASLEMSKAGVFFRAATIEAVDLANEENYVSSKSVANSLLNNKEFEDNVCRKWSNLLIIDEGGLAMDGIVNYFKKAQEIYDGRIANLIIDYAQNIKGAEDISTQMIIFSSFKDYAKELRTKLFALTQCNKSYPNDYTPIEKNHLEGAGRFYHAMDYILSFWKSSDQKNRLHGKLLKERWGDADYSFDLVRQGLKYHSEITVPDKNSHGGL